MKPIPSITELQESLSNDFKSKLNIMSDNLKKVLNGFTSVLSAQFKLLYLYLSDIQNNIFPDTADLEINGGTLERQGRIYLNRGIRPATIGVFNLSITGVAGSVLRSNLTFKSNESTKSPGQLYVLDSEYTLTGTDDIIEVRSFGAGTDFGLDVSDELTITEPVLGVNQTVSVFEILEQPKASEDVEDYRQAILDSIQLEPQGGSRTDYRLWSNDAQGVRRVYPYVKNDDAGTVQVYVESTIADSTDGNGTPTPTILSDVEDVIYFDPDETKPTNERGRIPMQVTLEVLPIVLIPIVVTVTGLNESSASIQLSVENAIKDYLYNLRPYIAGADLPRNKNNVFYEARLQGAVSDALSSSNFFTNFASTVNGNIVSSYQFDLGNIPYLQTLNFV